MKILIDSGNIVDIKWAKEFFPVGGVTTNPSLLAKEKTRPEITLDTINHELSTDQEFHIQLLSEKAEEMVKEADELIEKLGPSLFIKVPVSLEGCKAIKILAGKGIKVTATTVFSVQQGMIAALAGAYYIAPYVNRINSYNGNADDVICKLTAFLDNRNFQTKVLAASFKNTMQVENAFLSGANTVTVPPNILNKMRKHSGTEVAIEGFADDFRKAFPT